MKTMGGGDAAVPAFPWDDWISLIERMATEFDDLPASQVFRCLEGARGRSPVPPSLRAVELQARDELMARRARLWLAKP